MAKPFSIYLGKIALMTVAALFVACGDDSSGSGPENTESSAVEESSSSIEVISSSVNGDSGTGARMTSSGNGDSGSATIPDTSSMCV